MLQVTVPEFEIYSSEENLFSTIKEQTLAFEHSLLSISKWESKYCKPFLDKNHSKSLEETLYYLQCMCLTPNVNPVVFKHLPSEAIDELRDYIDTPKTATWFSENGRNSKSTPTLTSELIYYYMIANNIPFECQKWHLSRLITLIRICSEKNSPKKKMSKKDIFKQNSAINAARRSALKSKG